jgi:hypothetical protein
MPVAVAKGSGPAGTAPNDGTPPANAMTAPDKTNGVPAPAGSAAKQKS